MDEPCCTVCRLGQLELAIGTDERPLLRAEPGDVRIVVYHVTTDGRPTGEPRGSHLPTERWIPFGRSKDAALRIPDDSKLSRYQGAFHFRDGLVFVVDTRSACGTWLDGRSVDSAPLRQDSIVVVGDTAIVVETR